MPFNRTFFALVFALCLMFLSPSYSGSAAIQCFTHEPFAADSGATVESNATAESTSPEPRPLEEILGGDEPADREGAIEITGDDPGALSFNVRFAGENILRCLDYGDDRILIDNATPEFQSVHFTAAEISGGDDLILADTDPSVYTGTVWKPLKLADGRFLVEFTARHDDLWFSGEMVFVEHKGEFYLDSTYLNSVRDANASVHTVQINEDGIAPNELTVAAEDEVHFIVNIKEEVTFSVSADNSGEVVWEGQAGAPGPEWQYIFYAADVDPGDYTATITTSAGETEVLITVEP